MYTRRHAEAIVNRIGERLRAVHEPGFFREGAFAEYLRLLSPALSPRASLAAALLRESSPKIYNGCRRVGEQDIELRPSSIKDVVGRFKSVHFVEGRRKLGVECWSIHFGHDDFVTFVQQAAHLGDYVPAEDL